MKKTLKTQTTEQTGEYVARAPLAPRSVGGIVLREATIDGKGLGNTINALARQGLIEPAYALVDGQVLGFNSTWAYTDWRQSQGYYGPRAAELPSCELVTRVG